MNATDGFRHAMRRVPTGVALVTTSAEGQPKGFTANAFTSVSAEPPLILVCVNRAGRSHAVMCAAGFFCVNVLTLEQQSIAERFAARREGVDPFGEIAYRVESTGAPVIEGALAYFDCRIVSDHMAGSHTVFIGAVERCDSHAGAPLGYFDGAYRDFGARVE